MDPDDCPNGSEALVYFGSHDAGPGIGISRAVFDPNTGGLSTPRLAIEETAPAFFIIHPNGRTFYTCNSVDEFLGAAGGGVSAYAIDPATGSLDLLNRQSSCGGEPCHLSLDRTGRFLLTANYNGGNVCVYAVAPDGRLGKRTAVVQQSGSSINRDRQEGPHSHAIEVDPENRFVLVPNLGADQLSVYRFDAGDGSLQPHEPPFAATAPGAGPRHLCWSADGETVYLINELNSTIAAFSWDGTSGRLRHRQTISTLPHRFAGTSACAEIETHPNGRFVYASNRGHDSIAVFAIKKNSGELSLVEHVSTSGRTPRNFDFDPSGRWMVATNQESSTAVVFAIDPASGRLTQTGSPVSVPNPFGIRFLIGGKQPA